MHCIAGRASSFGCRFRSVLSNDGVRFCGEGDGGDGGGRGVIWAKGELEADGICLIRYHHRFPIDYLGRFE